MLALSLQAVAAGPKPLRLQRFATSIASSELLAALPASLTELSLEGSAFEGGLAIAQSVGAAAARCKQLQALSIAIGQEEYGPLEAQSLAGLSNLTRLHSDDHGFGIVSATSVTVSNLAMCHLHDVSSLRT
jgi:hypothetical protein